MIEPRRDKTGLRGFLTRSDTNRHIQSENEATRRSMKVWTWVAEKLYVHVTKTKALIS